MDILTLIVNFYNTFCDVFNRGISNYWNLMPTGVRWANLLFFGWLIYQWGRESGRKSVLRKLRKKRKDNLCKSA